MRAGVTPVSINCARFAAGRSMWALPCPPNCAATRVLPRSSTSRWRVRWRRGVGRVRGEAVAHGGEGAGRMRGDRSSPSGVNGGDGAAALIDQQDGDAVGGLHGDDGAGRILEERVAFPENAGAAFAGDASRKSAPVSESRGWRRAPGCRHRACRSRGRATGGRRARKRGRDSACPYRTRIKRGSGSGRSGPAA